MKRTGADAVHRLSAAAAATAIMMGAVTVGVVTVAQPASAAVGDLILASTSDSGVKGGSFSSEASLSADGSLVVFTSSATNLDPADADGGFEVYAKDLLSGDTSLVGSSDAGVSGNGHSFEGSPSADGSTVGFTTDSNTLDPADTDADYDVYVKDLASGDLTLASTSDTGAKGNRNSSEPSLSAEGRIVAFSSLSTNLDPAAADPDDVTHVYVKNTVTGNIALATTSDNGVRANNSSYRPSLSADGGAVAFLSYATNLDPADTDASPDIYVKDLASGNITLASASDSGVKGNDGAADPSLSADGGTVAFTSEATNLDPADTDTLDDVYVKTLAGGNIALASTSDSGTKGSGLSFQTSLSGDAGSVAFSSKATNLDPADSDTLFDVYVKDLASGDISLATTSESGVKADRSTFEPSSSADGARVAFTSEATNLDPADSSPDSDVYVKTLGSATPPLTISVGDRTLREGNTGTRTAMFTVQLSRASSARVTLDFATAAGTAKTGKDFVASSGSVTFAPGQTAKRIAITILCDRIVEPDESFTVKLSHPAGARIADGKGVGGIGNDD